MATPNFYATITPLTGGMNVLLWVPNEGATYKTSLTALASYVLAQTGSSISTTPVTVAQLPTATSSAGARAMVTNASATTFNSIVAGGGSNIVPVFCDGTNWRIG